MRTVVVGAGVLGASTAYHLAHAGVKVVVVDAGLDGRATAAGAGIICPWVSGVADETFYRLYAAGGEYYPDLIARCDLAGQTDLGFRRAGAMLVSGDAEELDWLERRARRRQAQAPAMGEVTRLSAQDARVLFPPLRQDFGGVHVAGGARVDGRLLAAALLRAAEHHGATVIWGHARLRVDTGRVTGIDLHRKALPAEPVPAGASAERTAAERVPAERTAAGRVPAERIPADRVILTTGAWANQVLRPFGLGLPIEPQRGQIVHLRLEGVQTEDWPVILPPGSHYIVPFDGGRVVVGATRESGTGFDYRVTAAGQADVLSQALEVAPGLGSANMIETRVGFRPVGDEVRPLLGWVPSIEGLAVGNGLGAAGLTIGPFAGRLLADLVLGRPSLLDLAPFNLMRQMGQAAGPPAALR